MNALIYSIVQLLPYSDLSLYLDRYYFSTIKFRKT